MNKLSVHINKLILKHNCVIIPNLGGFITQNVPAKFVDETNTFYPPMRSIGFNPQLTINDGLLVQSYMQTYDLDYPESVNEIENSVKDIQQTLNNTGFYDFTGIGRLSRNHEGKMVFAASKTDVCSPEFYGLKSFTTTLLDNSLASASAFSVKQSSKRNYTFSVNRELVNYLTAAVLALLLYFVWATPLSNNGGGLNMNQASVLSKFMFEKKEMPKEVVKNEAKENADVENLFLSVLRTSSSAKNQEESAPAENVQPAIPEKGFTIVLASAIPEKNAEAFIENLRADGYNEAQIFHDKHMLRVIYGSYEDIGQAYAALSACKNNKSFRQAWVMEVK